MVTIANAARPDHASGAAAEASVWRRGLSRALSLAALVAVGVAVVGGIATILVYVLVPGAPAAPPGLSLHIAAPPSSIGPGVAALPGESGRAIPDDARRRVAYR